MANRLDAVNPTMNSRPSVSQATKASSSAARPANNGNVVKRLQSELMTLMTSPTPGISAFPTNDITKWNATMSGPSATPYDGLTFKLTVSYPANYPLSPPEVLFKTPIYHPNVDFSGRICLDILKAGGEGKEGAWSAVLNTGSVLLSIQSLLGEPNNASPLNGEAAILWDRDQDEFKKKVLARHREPADVDDSA